MSFRKQAKSGNWDACWWDVRQGSLVSVRVLSEDDAARYQQTGVVHDWQRPGRPRVTTARADCDITLTYLRQLAAKVTARQYGVSGQTICNRLRRNESGHAARTLVR